ncbi:HlyD family efflux transporter periplasmic adaptor subunit [Chroococcus sp. FPU101]|uniref:HlyD family efflux transporter periplasmic adaptor subunit n=1 Tax=Chroococcus sp. FPU101 TaxID=1974212 RepID=UPI001A8F506B|nr:HlyD family efflux transporter periplasmic adaptor subunit [Chroococcus sp. FPU101]GFE69551.1 glycolipid ABC transporter membrane protein [Chroococcus sp. FPU101]
MKSVLLFKLSQRTTSVLVSLALAASGLTLYSFGRFRQKTTASIPSAVAAKPQMLGVAAIGYLEPQGGVIQVSTSSFREGVRIDQLLVTEGEQVQKGQVIAVLDNQARLQAVLREAQQQEQVAQARLAQVKAGAKQGEITAQNARFQGSKAELEGQISVQRASIANVDAQLKGERNAQQAAIAKLEAEWQNAKVDCQRYQSLYQNGGMSAREKDTICLKEATVRKELQQAQAVLMQIMESRTQQVLQAQANLQRTIATSQRQITEAQATLEAIAQVRPVDIQVAESQVAATQAAVQRAQADLALSYVRAPRTGQIIKINTWPGEVISDKGIVDLGQTDQMYVTAEVYETDISRVKLGQSVKIRANGVIENLTGIVAQIGLQIGKKQVVGNDPTAEADARVVEVKIRLTPEASRKVANLTNLQVNAIIDTSESNSNPL